MRMRIVTRHAALTPFVGTMLTRSNLHASTVCDILCMKINNDLECYKSLCGTCCSYQAKAATSYVLLKNS